MAVNFPKKAGEKNWMQVQLEEVRLQVNGLLANQRMEFICVSTLGAIAGAGIGWLVGILNGSMPPHNPATPLMASIKDCKPLVGALVGGSRVQSRNFAIMLGAHAAISNLTKEWGKLETSVVSGFGSGALFSLACDIGRPVSVVPNALASGILFGFVQGQISKKFEYRFKKAFIMDAALPLLTESVLKEEKIPSAARLIIMDYIEREPEYRDKRKRLKLSVQDEDDSDETAANSHN